MMKRKSKKSVAKKSEPRSNDERRREYSAKRRKKRRIKNIISSIIGILVLLGVGIAIFMTAYFNIAAVTVEVKERYTAEQVASASGITVGENLFRFSSKDAAAKIEKELPYAGEVKVSRKLPDTVHITVTLTAPFFAAETEGGFAILNRNGKVLEITGEKPENVPALNLGKIKSAQPGEIISAENPNALSKASSLADAAANAELGVTAYDVSDEKNIFLVCENGDITIETGKFDNENIQRKMLLAAETVKREKENDKGAKGTVDLSYDGKAYFRPAAEKTESPKQESELPGSDAESQPQ